MGLLRLRRQVNIKSFIYVRTKGGGVKRLYRSLDLSGLLQIYLSSVFLKYVYDPCRTAYLSMFVYFNGILGYRIGTHQLEPFSLFSVHSEDIGNFRIGAVSHLFNFKGGSNLHSIPLIKNSRATLARAAGLFVYLLRNDFVNRLSFLRIRRGLTLIFDFNTIVTFGRVCNLAHFETLKGKAGVSRLLGERPIVRGIAMNPVDHPNGGRTPGGKVYRSFSNKIARSSRKTRSKYRFYNKYIITLN